MLQTGSRVRWDIEWSRKRMTRLPDLSRGIVLSDDTKRWIYSSNLSLIRIPISEQRLPTQSISGCQYSSLTCPSL